MGPFIFLVQFDDLFREPEGSVLGELQKGYLVPN